MTKMTQKCRVKLAFSMRGGKILLTRPKKWFSPASHEQRWLFLLLPLALPIVTITAPPCRVGRAVDTPLTKSDPGSPVVFF